MATSVISVINMGDIAPRAGFEPTSIAFWASVLTITFSVPDVTSLPTHPYTVNAASRLTGLCRPLQLLWLRQDVIDQSHYSLSLETNTW